MKISEHWLREWVDPPVSTAELAEQLTMAGLEVDSVTPAAPAFDGVVVARVRDVAPHPDADKLRVCQVDVGSGEPLNIVCGAANVRRGLCVPAAVVGARLPGDFTIKRAKLRGVESLGMLCSAKELGLAEVSEGLMELPDDAPVGASLREYLGLDDQVIDVDLTPNRGDCLGVAGIAREVGVLNRAPVNWIRTEPIPQAIDDTFPVEVEVPTDCPRYLGRVMRGVHPAAATPLWMQERLRRGGIRSLGPLVDVTNYVLLELGQPMHAFDLGRLEGGIRVRRAADGEQLTLLDGKVVEVDSDTLLIADHVKPLAMAGIMGGADSGVGEGTVDLFLECAYFAPTAIAGRARRYGLQTDSSHRFERGVDPELQHRAMERATRLLLDIVGGRAGPVIETAARSHLPVREPIVLRRSRLRRLLGIDVDATDVAEVLERLGMQVKAVEEGWRVVPPSFRFDIAIEADLIEEVSRIYGYQRIPSRRPGGRVAMHVRPEATLPLPRLHQLLVDRGYQEVVTYSFVDPAMQESLHPGAAVMHLANPISSEMAVMRASLWTGLLGTLIHNRNRQQERVRIFESGLKFIVQDNELKQVQVIAGAIAGDALPEGWSAAGRAADFYDLKGDVEALLHLTGCGDDFIFTASRHPALHPGQSASIKRNNKAVGWAGSLHPEVQQKLGVSGNILLFELELEGLQQAAIPRFQALSKYPSIRRDLAVVVDEGVSARQLRDCVREAVPDLLQEMRIFDVYRGKGIDSGRKSLAFGLILQESSRTLTDSEVDAAIDRVVAKLKQELGAALRD
ncbi:MAG: phenylalanine--tRNA ligase subunit beta [Gammaproteobacteria bacterium]